MNPQEIETAAEAIWKRRTQTTRTGPRNPMTSSSCRAFTLAPLLRQ
jgi:hypothetical protein